MSVSIRFASLVVGGRARADVEKNSAEIAVDFMTVTGQVDTLQSTLKERKERKERKNRRTEMLSMSFQMRGDGIQPNVVTYTTMIDAYAKNGR